MAHPIPWYRRLDLTTDPFAPGPARGSWVMATPQWRIQADSLIKTALTGAFIGLVKGDVGSGKTTLLHQILEALEDRQDIRALPIACRDDGSLLRGLAPDADLGLDPYPALLAHLDWQCHQGLRPLALIDDAHLLSKDDLELLIRLSQPRDGEPPLLHTLLFADASIQARLNELDLSWSRINIHTLIPLPLTAPQTAQYIHHRLAAAGLKDDVLPLTPRQLTTLYRASGGLPGAINQLTGQLLTRRYGSWLGQLTPRLPTLPRLPRPVRSSLNWPGRTKRQRPGRRRAARPASHWARPALGLAGGIGALGLGLVLWQWLPASDPSAASAALESAPNPALQVLPLPARPGDLVPAGSAARPAPAMTATTTADWLTDLPADHYLIQLMSGTREQSLVETVGGQLLPDNWGYFPRQQGGRTWYVAVMGPYPDQDRAQAALAELPETLRRNKPLIRSVASLQPELSSVKTP